MGGANRARNPRRERERVGVKVYIIERNSRLALLRLYVCALVLALV